MVGQASGLVRATTSNKPILVSSLYVSTTGRSLVLCFDGTANEPGMRNTNVVEFFLLLWKDKDKQPVYYQVR